MLRLSTRIGIGYGVAVTMLLLALGIGLITFEVVRDDAERLSQRLIPSITSANGLMLALEQMENSEFMYLLPNQDVAQWTQRFDVQARRFKADYITVEKIADQPEELALVARIGQQFGAFSSVSQRIREAIARRQIQQAIRLNTTESVDEADRLRQSINQLRNLDLASINQAQFHEGWIVGLAEMLVAFAALLGVFLAGLQWRQTTYTIVDPLLALRRGTDAVAQGNFVDVQHPAFARTYELQALQQGFNSMSERLGAITSNLEGLVSERTLALEKSNRQLVKALAELKTLDQMKTDLMNVVSHELLTPINFILAYGSSLEDGVLGELTAPQRQAVSRMNIGAQRLTRMVRNILDFTTLEKGNLEVHPESVDYSVVLREAVEAYRTLAESKQQRFQFSDPGLLMVFADPHRLVQIVQELLDNAVKFTPEGGRIALRVSQSPDIVTTEISDTGIGIPVDKLPTLFHPFQQLDLSTTRQYGGLGMGLAIVHQLIQEMGGEISIESKLGRGTTVRFKIPRAQS